jgi:hypothetical protein
MAVPYFSLSGLVLSLLFSIHINCVGFKYVTGKTYLVSCALYHKTHPKLEMTAVTLDFFSRVDVSHGIILDLLLRDSLSFCYVPLIWSYYHLQFYMLCKMESLTLDGSRLYPRTAATKGWSFFPQSMERHMESYWETYGVILRDESVGATLSNIGWPGRERESPRWEAGG